MQLYPGEKCSDYSNTGMNMNYEVVDQYGECD